MRNRYDQNKEIRYITTNLCNMARMNMQIFEENYQQQFAAKKDPKQKVRKAQKVYIIHPCNLVNKEHINIEQLKKADKVVILGCYRKDDFKELDNVEYWNIKDIQTKAERLVFRQGDYAEVRVNYGCNQSCSFCPIKRNENYDRPIQELVNDIGDAKRVKLSSDDLASYKYGLVELMEALPDKHIELTYVYPTYLVKHKDYFIANKHRIDIMIPMQSGSERILKLMNRGDYTVDEVVDVVKKLNKVSCHFIYGSPTETWDEFMMTFNIEKYFANPHWFKYQSYEGTKWHKEYGFTTSPEIEKMEKFLIAHSKGGVIDWGKNKTINR